MSDDALTKALAAATEAAQDSKQLELMHTVLMAQAIAAAVQPQQCQHHDTKSQRPFDARKWWTIGGLACVGGCIACALALAFAMAFIALAIGATCATACLLILRRMWRDYLNGR
ncbi:hypothetical protein [Streptomyces griseorubiginosus]|uniref:hypothetical protein n=1 Tax=Streptomyces griseorubiginosus TaxID=67304 RepID=UPI0036ED221F